MKVLFILPKLRLKLFGYSGGSLGYPHLGLACLTAILRRNNFSVGLIEHGEDESEESLFDRVKNFGADIIGVTAYTPNRSFAYKIINSVRKHVAIPLVVGGPHVSTFKGAVLSETLADFAIKQEGEYTLLEFVTALAAGKKDFNDINGLIWKKNGAIIENQDRPFIKDFDALPFPDFSLFKIKEHAAYNKKVLPVMTSRSCPYNCDFCAAKTSMGQGFRPRSAQNVVAELKYHYENGYSQFDFNDDCFSVDLKRAKDILDLIIASGMKISFQFLSGLRVDRIDRELFVKLKQAGCYYIMLGCESGNEEVLRDINKGITLGQVRKAVELSRQVGILNSVNFIIGHRNETFRKAMDTINFAHSLNTSVNIGQLIPYPGTAAYEWVKKHGSFLVDENSYFEVFSWETAEPLFETKEFSRRERKKILQKAFALHEFMVFRLRFGKVLGYLIYALTRVMFLKRALARFVFGNRIGNKIAVLLSKKSYSNN